MVAVCIPDHYIAGRLPRENMPEDDDGIVAVIFSCSSPPSSGERLGEGEAPQAPSPNLSPNELGERRKMHIIQ